jgi:RimJ/RimL family protein N-acetyltransferase
VTLASFGPLDASTIARLAAIVPDDDLRARRTANLARAVRVVVATAADGHPVGVAYARTLFGIPNVTWIVAAEACRQGIATRIVAELQKDFRVLTAICRNEASVRVARRTGFVLAFGRFAVWIRYRRR